MANPTPLMAKSSGTDHADAAVESALRTLDAEGSGISAITAALQSDLRAPFADVRWQHDIADLESFGVWISVDDEWGMLSAEKVRSSRARH